MQRLHSFEMSPCTICDDAVTKKNPLLECVVCKLKVHKLCYGIGGPNQNWKCSPCRLGQTKFAKCQHCLKNKGAMKQTSCKKWVHVICALFTKGVIFLNEKTLEPIDISKVRTSKHNKRCSFCYSAQGHCSPCNKSSCKEKFHITCDQKFKTLEEDVNPIDNKITFNAYCNAHKPKESRRLSSETIRNAVEKSVRKL